MNEPDNCECLCHQEVEEQTTHPPHIWSPGYLSTDKHSTVKIHVCYFVGCDARKEDKL